MTIWFKGTLLFMFRLQTFKKVFSFLVIHATNDSKLGSYFKVTPGLLLGHRQSIRFVNAIKNIAVEGGINGNFTSNFSTRKATEKCFQGLQYRRIFTRTTVENTRINGEVHGDSVSPAILAVTRIVISTAKPEYELIDNSN